MNKFKKVIKIVKAFGDAHISKETSDFLNRNVEPLTKKVKINIKIVGLISH